MFSGEPDGVGALPVAAVTAFELILKNACVDVDVAKPDGMGTWPVATVNAFELMLKKACVDVDVAKSVWASEEPARAKAPIRVDVAYILAKRG